MRCTAPMKAPSPPPTMPSRMRRPAPAGDPAAFDSIVIARPSQAQHAAQLRRVRLPAGEVVERLLGDADDVAADELGPFRGALLGVLQAALPLEHGPAVVAVLRHLREDGAEVDLPVAERAEAPGPVHPRLVAGVHALPAGGPELRVLHVEGLDALVIDVDELEV